jgi:hypothetical protein
LGEAIVLTLLWQSLGGNNNLSDLSFSVESVFQASKNRPSQEGK